MTICSYTSRGSCVIAVASGGMELKMETVSMCLRGQLVAVVMHELNSWYNNYELF